MSSCEYGWVLRMITKVRNASIRGRGHRGRRRFPGALMPSEAPQTGNPSGYDRYSQMDIIDHCLSLAPVPYLRTAFSIFRIIHSTIQHMTICKRQIQVLTSSVAELLNTLDSQYRTGKIGEETTSLALQDLERQLREIAEFAKTNSECGFLQALFFKEQRIAIIEGYHRRLTIAVSSFQISSLLDIRSWQSRNDKAREDDRQSLDARLSQLESNQGQLMAALNASQKNMRAMMAALQRSLDQHPSGDRERQFYSHSLDCLSIVSGSVVELDKWTITPFEVEFGPEIGSGGFGMVLKGTWNKTTVALKVLKTDEGAIPSTATMRNEIEIWSTLSHPNIIQFLGANVLDDRPFIVMPFFKNGNARDYLRSHADCDRLKILYHISLGIVFLHSKKIVHGDLKAMNVLIDDGQNAVLCDFGLSRVRSDVTMSTLGGSTLNIMGTRNWMAPERLMGGSLKKPCDIYSFGMTAYEIYANETPLSQISFMEFTELVARQGIRPERPDLEDAPELSDDIWNLSMMCWAQDPSARPSATSVCDIITQLRPRISSGSLLRPSQPLAPPDISPSDTPMVSPPTKTPPSSPGSRRIPSIFRNPFSSKNTPPSTTTTPTEHPQILLPESTSSGTLMPTFTIPTKLKGHTNSVRSVTFSPDGSMIASGSYDKTIRVWNVEKKKLVCGPIKAHFNTIYSIAFSPSGKQIVSGSGDFTIKVWDVTNGQLALGPLQGHRNAVLSVSFSPDGKLIASGSSDGSVQVWDADTEYNKLGPFQGHTGSVNSISFSPDGKRVASGSSDCEIRIWDVDTGQTVAGPFQGDTKGVASIAFSPDGTRIASGSWGDSVRVWNADTGSLVSGPPHCFAGHTDSIRCVVVYSPDGKWIATCCQDKIIRVFDAETGYPVTRPVREDSVVQTIAFSPDGRKMASGSDDKTVRIYDIRPVHITN